MGKAWGKEFPKMLVNCDMVGAYVSIDKARSWQLFHYLDLESSIVCKPMCHPDGSFLFAAGGASRLKVAKGSGNMPKDWQWAFANIVELTDGNQMHGFPERLVGEFANDHLTGLMPMETTDDYSFPGYAFIGKPEICSGIEVTREVSHIWRSDDEGATWKRATAWETPGSFLGFHFDQRMKTIQRTHRVVVQVRSSESWCPMRAGEHGSR